MKIPFRFLLALAAGLLTAATLLAGGPSVSAATVNFTGLDTTAVRSASGQNFPFTAGTGGSTGTVNVRLVSGDLSGVTTGSSPDATGFYALREGSNLTPAVFRFTFNSAQTFIVNQNETVAALENEAFKLPSGTWTILSTSNVTVGGSGGNVSFQGTNNSPPYGDYSLTGTGTSFDFTITDAAGFSTYGSALSLNVVNPVPGPSSVALTVPGKSNLWLAGAAPGTTASSGQDTLTNATPFRVSGITLTPGATLTFTATGNVSNDPVNPVSVGPDGGPYLGGTFYGHEKENGIGDIIAPINSLIGVFLDDSTPNAATTPDGTDFSSGAGIDYTLLAPSLRKPFFIGNGKTADGSVQKVQVPAGATRLFLGALDPSDQENNLGSFSVAINGGGGVTNPPTTSADLAISVSATTNGLNAGNNGNVANYGDKITYRLTVKNNGTATARQIVLLDNLPGGLTFASATDGGAIVQGLRVQWNLGNLAPNESRTVQLVAKASGDALTIGSTVVNKAITATANNSPDLIPLRNLDGIATLIQPLVNLTATSDASTIAPGGTLTYRVHVESGSTGRSADNVLVAINVPDNVNLLNAFYFVNNQQTPAGGSGKTLLFNLGSILAGSSGRDLTIQVQVPYDVAPAAAIALNTVNLTATRAGTTKPERAILPDLTATLSGQAPTDPPQLRLVKFVPDAVSTAQLLALVPAARPALEFAFPGVSTAAGLDSLQRTVNPFVLVGNAPNGSSYEQDVIAPGRPGGPAQTFLTYALVYYNDANDNAAGGAGAPNSLIVDRVPDYTAYVPGSAKVGLLAQEPTVTDGGKTLTFPVGKIKPLVNSASPTKPARVGLITYQVRVLAPAEGGRSALRTTIDAAPAFLSTPVLTNRVPSFPGGNSSVLVAPAHGVLQSLQRPASFLAGAIKEYDVNYKNDGGLPALDFQFADSYPAGSTFVSVTPVRGRSGNVTDLSAANHAFTYHLGNVQPGESGTVRLRVQLTDVAVKQPGLVGIHSVTLLPEASFGAAVTRSRQPGRGPVTRDVTLPLLLPDGSVNISRSEVPGAPHLGIGISAPLSVKAGDTFDYLAFLSNASNAPAFGTAIIVNIPDGTTFVSASQDNAFVGSDPLGRAVIFPNQTANGTNLDLAAHSARLCRVTLRAPSTPPSGDTLRTPGVHTLSTGAVVVGSSSLYTPVNAVYSQAISTFVYRADRAFDGTLKAQIVASSLATQGFNTAAFTTSADFKAQVAGLLPGATHTSSGSLDCTQLSNGGLLAPLGAAPGQPVNFLAIGPASAFALNGGGLVASGGGNLVASGGGNLVASGGGNFIGLTNLVASGGGNLVASGGGNLNALQAFGNLVASGGGNIFVRLANGNLVASGGGNLVASGGGNLVASGGGNLVASGGGNLISQDGGGLRALNLNALISQDGGGILAAARSPLIGQDGGSLIGQDGGSLISQDGGSVLANRGGNALVAGGSGLISQDGGSLIGQDGGSLISQDGGGAVTLTPNGLVASGGGNLTPLVASGAGN